MSFSDLSKWSYYIECLHLGAPLHWIYDRDKLVKLTEEKNCVVFYPESHCPYYTVPTGSNSAYGDQLYFTLKNVLDTKGLLMLIRCKAIFTEYQRSCHATSNVGD